MNQTEFPLIAALKRQNVTRTPIWIMRQAGRYLPEYRKVRKKAGNFINLMKNPEFLDNNEIMLKIAYEFNNKHCKPPLSSERIEKCVKQSIGYALTNLKNKGLVDIEKSITFD